MCVWTVTDFNQNLSCQSKQAKKFQQLQTQEKRNLKMSRSQQGETIQVMDQYFDQQQNTNMRQSRDAMSSAAATISSQVNGGTPSRHQRMTQARSRQHLATKSAASISNRSRPMSAMQNKAYSYGQNQGASEQKRRTSNRANSAVMIQKSLETKLRGEIDEQKLRNIWRALGSYVAKQLVSGKGVTIPRFGTFTFTAAEVNLTGTTNPQARDHQIREPVFSIGKDFVSAITLKPGISHNRGGQIRPHALNGASGIIPLVKINYCEVGLFCGLSKDQCRKGCEQMFRNLSDKARRGENVAIEIPLIGRFLTRGNVAAIDFSQDLVEQTRGNTAKGHNVGNLFGSSNACLNMNIHQQEKNKGNSQLGLGGAIKVQTAATNWMKNNLDIDLDELPVIEERQGSGQADRIKSAIPSARRQNAEIFRSGSQTNFRKIQGVALSEANLQELNGGNRIMNKTRSFVASSQGGRPMSAATYTTQMASHMSQLPTLSTDQVMAVARTLFQSRSAIIHAAKATGARFNLRDTISSTQIYQIYKRNGIQLELAHLKVLLRELGLPFNGLSCSLTLLLQACKAFLHGITGGYGTTSQASGIRSTLTPSDFSAMSRFGGKDAGALKNHAAKVRAIIRDVIYTSKENLYDLFKVGMTGNSLDLEGLLRIVSELNCGLPEDEVTLVFKSIPKNKNDKISFQYFEEAFRSEEPSSEEFETVVIRKVREWMFKNKLSSEIAFDALCRSAGRFVDKTLSRAQFHKAMVSNDVGLSAVQIDCLFASLTPDAQSPLDIRSWQSRIYEDSDNPLQMIRETVNENQLTQDDLLYQMKLRVWDDALDKQGFFKAMRNLDPSISDVQIKAIFAQLKNDQSMVPICDLIRNFTGQAYETVDYRNDVYKKVYSEIYPNKEEQVIQLLQEYDDSNVGLITAKGLLNVLSKVIKKLSTTELERFVRFLDKDKLSRINYMDFLGKVCKVSNKNHNPFKSVISRLSYFLTQNKISSGALLKRLASASSQNTSAAPGIVGIPTNLFAEFLKQKVEKKRNLEELCNYSNMIDIDKDGFVTEADIETCIKNLPNMAFFRNGGAALTQSTFNSQAKIFPKTSRLSKEKALAVCKQIREALAVKRMQYRDAFNKFDIDKDNMVSFAEFNRGMAEVCDLSVPVKEQIYSLMDKNSIGLISYDQFLDVLRQENLEKKAIEDNFDWEQSTIEQIKQWIQTQKLTVHEAFKCFDKDFDGFISKKDLKESLTDILEINPNQIQPTKLDRLFRLMDFFKSGQVQVSDFQRLMTNTNPYAETFVPGIRSNMTRSLGGGLQNTSTFDWKFSVIQQIGLMLSKKYASVEKSFREATEGQPKLKYAQFSEFLEREHALQGFNLTQPLIQKLFSELDPHKKGFMNINDWRNAFKSFNTSDQLIVELKNVVQSTFTSCDSVFHFFINFSNGGGSQITYPIFEKAVHALTSERFAKADVQRLWKQLASSDSPDCMSKHHFREHFESMSYKGNSSVGTLESLGQTNSTSLKSTSQKSKTTIQTVTSSSSQWENNVIERMRVIIATSSKSVQEIFNEFDEDGNGFVTQTEFRNALRRLNLGITSREIDQVMERIDTNGDGKIDYQEFAAKFKNNSLDTRMAVRAANRMAKLKELMNLHMTSANDAFRFFDAEKDGRITFADFSKLVSRAHELAGEKVPTYPIIKDLFDTIDIRKDGMLDLHEWQQTFSRVEQGNSKISFRTTELSSWENSREFQQLGALMAKNRKLITQKFREELGGDASQKAFTFKQGKRALDEWLYSHYGDSITDAKLRCLFNAAKIHSESQAEPKYDYIRMLDINKSRHSGPQVV